MTSAADVPHLPSHIEHLDTAALVPYVRNSRTHSPEQVAAVARSIQQFGFTNPVLIDAHNTIIAGHGRVMAAQSIGLGTVPCIRLSHLTDAQRRAYVIADNKLPELSGWDLDALASEVESLIHQDAFDIDLLGFGADELVNLLQDHAQQAADAQPPGAGKEDEAPELPAQPASRLGDVWLLGKHRVMCGDSLASSDVSALMEGAKADMVFTDPPYGVSFQSNSRVKSAKFDVIANDDVFLDIAPVIDAYSIGFVFVWTSWKVLTTWIKQFERFGYPSNIVVWHKPGGSLGDLKKTFSSDYEVALVWHRGAGLCGKRIGSVWTVGKDAPAKYMHPTQKPVALANEALDKTTMPGATVLDLFGGSGTTLIACENTKRVARLMELDPKYCDVIVRRWQDFTGNQAKLEATGQTFAQVQAQRVPAAV